MTSVFIKILLIFFFLLPSTDPITPLSIEMLAGEDLPHLLQTLLVGVEHAICRIPLDELTFPPFPPCPNVSNSNAHNVIEFAADYSTDEKNAASKRAECNLKRRELITKNNSINKKYAIKRITCSGSSSQLTPNESETLDDEIAAEHRARELTASTNPLNDVSTSKVLTNETDSATTTTGAVASTLPLFCLGGSFPHIDSDEESGDDAKRTQTGECLNCVQFFNLSSFTFPSLTSNISSHLMICQLIIRDDLFKHGLHSTRLDSIDDFCSESQSVSKRLETLFS